MRTFNTTDLFTGYLKQLLHDFNLPKIRVYTKEQQEYFEKTGHERFDVLETTYITDELNNEHLRYIPYIKDGILQNYINGEWSEITEDFVDGNWSNVGKRNKEPGPHLHIYDSGMKLLNYTKNLKIKDNVYDSYTHEYLGDYLRFKRDYYNINLMPLYNCFSDRACDKLLIKTAAETSIPSYKSVGTFNTLNEYVGYYVSIAENVYKKITTDNKADDSIGIYPGITIAYRMESKIIKQAFEFDTDDKNYKIYMLPVKLFQKYTIAIDSELPVELCCGIYGKYQDKREKFKNIPVLTYKKLNYCSFGAPILYTELLNLNQFTLAESIVELAQNEADLKLFIKLPASNTSSIAVLEGDYLNWNDYSYTKPTQQIIPIAAHGKGAPGVIPTAEGNIYLDTATFRLYKYTNSEWVDNGLILPGIEHSKLNLIIDNKYYDAINTVEYFDYYKATSNKRINQYTLYLNTAVNYLYFPRNWQRKTNSAIINMADVSADNDIKLITPLQLLRLNTQTQCPFADRLIEYLLGNVITGDENEPADNVRRVQKVLEMDYYKNEYQTQFPDMWDNRINKIIYDYITTHQQTNTYDINHDILGYIDKDAEKWYTHLDIHNTVLGPVVDATSILNVELTEEEK